MRRLPLPDLVRVALTRFHAMQMAERRVARERYEASGYIVVDELGGVLNGAPASAWIVRFDHVMP